MVSKSTNQTSSSSPADASQKTLPTTNNSQPEGQDLTQLQPFGQIQQINSDNNKTWNDGVDLFTPGSITTTPSQEKITLKLNSAEFTTIRSSEHQAKILVDYETTDPSLSGTRINGILEVFEPDGTHKNNLLSGRI